MSESKPTTLPPGESQRITPAPPKPNGATAADATTHTPLTPWATVAQSHALDSSVSHARLSNLVVYTEDPKDEAYITETIAQFVVKHPCRVILILAQPRATESKLEGDVSTHTYTSGTGKSVVCDQITLKATGASVKELASAVQPLLVADLPIYLWWRGLFLSQRMLVEQMLAFADRFIYDGLTWTDIRYSVQQVSDLIDKYNEKVGFTNFNWARLRPWRESAADFFDAGMFEKEVWEINHVRIDYMALPGLEEGYQFRGVLFVSWLAVQLDWELVRAQPGQDIARVQFKSKTGVRIDAELVHVPQSGPSSQSLQKVVMGVRGGPESKDFVIERDHAEHLMVLCCEKPSGRQLLRRAPHSDSTTSDLLYRELGRRVRNRVFENSFKMAAKLLQYL